MHEPLTEVQLRTGESLKILVVEAPDDEHAGTVLNLLSHKGELRQWQFQEDFGGRAPGLRSRYYLGFLQGRAVANISVWESGVTGELGHVHTLEPYRRRGICKAVMEVQMEDFRRRGGRVLVLGTGYDSPAYHIYSSFGFRSMTPGSGAMVYLRDPDFFEDFFAAGPVECLDAEWRDLGTVCTLMAVPEGDWLRSKREGKYGRVNYEASYVRDMQEVRNGTRQARIARTDGGATVAYAVLGPDPSWSGQAWLLDVFAHPSFPGCVPDLLAAMHWPDRPVYCYLDADSPTGAGLLAAGFTETARWPGLLQGPEGPVDVAVLRRD